MRTTLFALLVTASCTKAAPSPSEEAPAPSPKPAVSMRDPNATTTTAQPTPTSQPAPPPPPPPVASSATVTLTSVTFADDCGGGAPNGPPPKPTKKAPTTQFAKPPPAAPAAPADRAAPPAPMPLNGPGVVAARRRCEQTSMQLEITATRDTEIKIASIDVFDETGKKIETLTASHPRQWAGTGYQDWNQKLAAKKSAQVTYALSQPTAVVKGPRDRMYTVKVNASIGGATQELQTTVMVTALRPALPT